MNASEAKQALKDGAWLMKSDWTDGSYLFLEGLWVKMSSTLYRQDESHNVAAIADPKWDDEDDFVIHPDSPVKNVTEEKDLNL